MKLNKCKCGSDAFFAAAGGIKCSKMSCVRCVLIPDSTLDECAQIWNEKNPEPELVLNRCVVCGSPVDFAMTDFVNCTNGECWQIVQLKNASRPELAEIWNRFNPVKK